MKEPALIYFADLTYVHQGLQSEIMPNAIGCVAAFTKQQLGERVELSIFKQPEKFIKALEGKLPEIVAFSNYAWNHNLAQVFARAIKRKHPEVVTVFGGPNYPLDEESQKQFLLSHPEVDFFVVKEGEVGFSGLVEELLRSDFNLMQDYTVPSVHFINRENNKIKINPLGPRIRDLTEIPSPYLLGWMDEFFDDGFMPIIQTNRGCPFSCTFCVEGVSYYSKIYRNSEDKVKKELKYIAQNMISVIEKGGRADLFIADSNFGMYKQDIETCNVIRDCQEQYLWPKYISVATGKNQKERVLEAARLVNGAIRLSGSVQSLDTGVLENIKRANVDPNQLVSLAMDGADIGANTYSEVILALPGDSREAYKKTVSRLVELGFNKVETYTLMLLPGSEMDSSETRAKYNFMVRYRVIPRCFGYFDYEGADISIGEIEEVVVGNNTMPFSDYVACRELALLISLFYNDQVFEPATKLLMQLKVPLMECISLIHEQKVEKGILEIFQNYADETKNELWESKEELLAFLSIRENNERYVRGELGSNLIFKYKSIAMLTEMTALARVLALAMKKAIANNHGALNHEQEEFIDELCGFCGARSTNVFCEYEKSHHLDVHFPLEDIVEQESFTDIGNILHAGEVNRLEFFMDDQQKDTIQRLINTYGNQLTGLTRALSRTNIRRLLRHHRSYETVAA